MTTLENAAQTFAPMLGFFAELLPASTAEAPKEAPLDAKKTSDGKDASNLNQLENKSVPKPEKTHDPLMEKIKTAERAVRCAHGEAQRNKFYQKAVTLWEKWLSDKPMDKVFGGSQMDFLTTKLRRGKPEEKVQAGLWLLNDEKHPYGHLLGSFHIAGVDGGKGYFTRKTLQKFIADYNHGDFTEGKKPAKLLKTDHDAKLMVVKLATEKNQGFDRDYSASASLLRCEEARKDFGNPDPAVNSAANTTYLVYIDTLSKEALVSEAKAMLEIVGDPNQNYDANSSATQMLYVLLMKSELPPSVLRTGIEVTDKLLQEDKFDSSLARRDIKEINEGMKNQLQTIEDSRKIFGSAMPSFKNLEDRKLYTEAFVNFRSAALQCHFDQNQARGEAAFDKAKSDYLKVAQRLNIPWKVNQTTRFFFADVATRKTTPPNV